jgi:hypothetical protein
MAQPQRPGGFDMARLTSGQKILLVAGILLFISQFFPWEDFGGGVEDVLGVDVDIPGATANGFAGIGILVTILVIAMLVWEGLLASGVQVNMGTTSPALIGAVIAGATALFTIIKFLTSLDAIAWAAWVGLILGLVIAYGAYLRFQESQTAVPPAAPPAP